MMHGHALTQRLSGTLGAWLQWLPQAGARAHTRGFVTQTPISTPGLGLAGAHAPPATVPPRVPNVRGPGLGVFGNPLALR